MAQRQFRSDDTSKWVEGFGNGSDGALTISSDTTEAPTDASCSGTAAATSLSATNASFASGQLILIHQIRGTGAGAWELNKISSYTAGTITLKYALCNTYTDSGASQAYVRVMKQYSSVTVDSGKTYTAKAWTGDVGGILGWFCNGTTTITGTVTATGKGYLGGNLTTSAGYSGEGTSGARNTRTNSYGNAGGGCDPSANAAGDGGGNGGAGSEGTGSSSATAGSTAGVAGLTTAVFGGGGSTSNAVEQQASAIGGPGGGFILIIAKNITITGTITGLGGAGGASTGGDYSRGGGGGAGGSILLKTQIGTLGTTKITATGGAGGTATGGTNGNLTGGAGGTGRIHLDYKTSYTGTTSPTLDARQDLSLNPMSSGFMAFL